VTARQETGMTLEPAPSLLTRLRWSIGLSHILLALLTIVVGFFVLYPMLMLVVGSFTISGTAATTNFTLDGYATALGDDVARKAMLTTIWLAIVRALLSVGLAIFLAWAIVRTDLPGRNILHTLMLANFFVPLLPQILAWTFLLAPRSGILNEAIRGFLGIPGRNGPFNIYSYEGIIFVSVLNWSAFLYMLVAPAFRAVDASLEEAARMAGATGLRTIRRISVPLLWPAVIGAFGLAFVRMSESFETELMLGVPANIYVFSTQIYRYLGQDTVPQFGPAIAMSMMFILLTGSVILLQRRVLRGRSFVTVGGKDYRARPSRLGIWKYPVLLLISFYFLLSLIMPTVFLALGSVQRSMANIRLDGFTLRAWELAGREELLAPLRNTLIVGVIAATIGIVVLTLVSYVVIRTKFRLRYALDLFTWVPYMVPSFVLGVGFLWAALRGIKFPIVLYGSLLLITIVFIVRVMPLGSRLMNGTMVQLSKELEEAGRIAGGTWTSTFRRVILPLLSPAIGIGWLIFMAVIIRDLSTIVLLFGPDSEMLSVKFFAYWRTGSLEGAAVIGLIMTLLGLGMATGVFLLQRLGRGSVEQAI
jgi:iron(III) transport system permease protein